MKIRLVVVMLGLIVCAPLLLVAQQKSPVVWKKKTLSFKSSPDFSASYTIPGCEVKLRRDGEGVRIIAADVEKRRWPFVEVITIYRDATGRAMYTTQTVAILRGNYIRTTDPSWAPAVYGYQCATPAHYLPPEVKQAFLGLFLY